MVTYKKNKSNNHIGRFTDDNYTIICINSNEITGSYTTPNAYLWGQFLDLESDATEFLLALQTVLNNRQNLVTEIENEILNENASTN